MSKAHPPELKNVSDFASYPMRGKILEGYQKLLEGEGATKVKHPETADLINVKTYMDKRLQLKLNGGRIIGGILRGFDPFMNLVIDEGIETARTGERTNIGMVVVRGNSIILLESMDRIA